MLLYTFYQPIFYATHDQHFPSESEERTVYWVGFAEHFGDSLTHKVLDAKTLKIFTEVPSGPELLRIPIKGLLMMEGSCRILGLTALNSLLQYVNWLVWEVCSVN